MEINIERRMGCLPKSIGRADDEGRKPECYALSDAAEPMIRIEVHLTAMRERLRVLLMKDRF